MTTFEVEHSHQLNDEVSLLVGGHLSRIEKLIRAAPAGALPDGTVLSQFQNREGFVHAAGAEAEAYAKAFVVADLESTGGHDVFGKIRQDFDAKGVNLSDHQIRRTMDELMARAINEVKASG